MSGSFTTYALAGHVLFTLLFVVLVMALMPRFMRSDVFFGVTVEPGFGQRSQGMLIRRRYVRRVLSVGVALLLVIGALFAFVGDAWRALSSTAGVFIAAAAAIWAFVAARREALPYAVSPSTVREASLAPVRWRMSGWVIAGPFLVLGAAVAWLSVNWGDLPDRFPVHFDASGAPDRFASKSFTSVFGLPIAGVMICGLMLLLGWSLRFAKRARVTGASGQHFTGMMRMTQAILLVVAYFIALLFGAIPIASMRPPEEAGRWVVLLAMGGTLGLLGVITVMMLHWASRTASARAQGAVGDGTPDACWKWGLFYYNPEDPALWVEKRFGIGYTTNMAHRGAWILLGGVLLVILATIVLAITTGSSGK